MKNRVYALESSQPSSRTCTNSFRLFSLHIWFVSQPSQTPSQTPSRSPSKMPSTSPSSQPTSGPTSQPSKEVCKLLLLFCVWRIEWRIESISWLLENTVSSHHSRHLKHALTLSVSSLFTSDSSHSRLRLQAKLLRGAPAKCHLRRRLNSLRLARHLNHQKR